MVDSILLIGLHRKWTSYGLSTWLRDLIHRPLLDQVLFHYGEAAGRVPDFDLKHRGNKRGGLCIIAADSE